MLQYLPFDIIKIIFDNIPKIIDKRNFIRSTKYVNNLAKSLLNNFLDTFSLEYNKFKSNETYRLIFEMCYDNDQDNIPKKFLKINNTNIINIMIHFKLPNFISILMNHHYKIKNDNIEYAVDYFDVEIINTFLHDFNFGNSRKYVKRAIIHNNCNFAIWYFKNYIYSYEDIHNMVIYNKLDMLQAFDIIYPISECLLYNKIVKIYCIAIFFGHLDIIKWLEKIEFNNNNNNEKIIRMLELCNNVEVIEYFNNKGYNVNNKIDDDYYYDELKKYIYEYSYHFGQIYNNLHDLCSNFASSNNLEMVKWLVSKNFNHDNRIFHYFTLQNNIFAMQYCIDNNFMQDQNIMKTAIKMCNLDTIKCLYNNGYKFNDNHIEILINNKNYDVIEWIKFNDIYPNLDNLIKKHCKITHYDDKLTKLINNNY